MWANRLLFRSGDFHHGAHVAFKPLLVQASLARIGASRVLASKGFPLQTTYLERGVYVFLLRPQMQVQVVA